MKTVRPPRISFLPLLLLASLLALPAARAQLGVQWITQYGTNVEDGGMGIVVDALGRSYVVGYTAGALNGAVNAGPSDFFLTRLSASGGLDFTQLRGGSANDGGLAITFMGSGTVVTGGSTISETVDGQPFLGELDALAVRYATDGTWQGTTRFGGTRSEFILSLAGNATNVLAAGLSQGAFDGQVNAGGTGQLAGADAFLTKRDSTGAVVWTRFVGTDGDDSGRGAAFDAAGNAYLAGYTNKAVTGASNGSYDLFLARFDAAGNQTLLKQIGSAGVDFSRDMKVDLAGNIYLTGSTDGALGGELNAGGTDAFVMKLDSAGNVVWTRLFGGAGAEEGYTLAVDEVTGHVWIGGYSDGAVGTHQNVGSQDAFVAEYDGAGQLLGTTFLATTGDDFLNGLAVGPGGAVYATGETTGDLGGQNAGGVDAFVAKLVPEPSSGMMLAGSALLLARRRRRKNKP